MKQIKLKDNYTIEILYKQFKNQALPAKERFFYSKLLLEQCITQIIMYPENNFNTFLDLAVLVNNRNIMEFLKSVVTNIDIETINYLNLRTIAVNPETSKDNSLFQRLATLFYNLINNEILIIKKDVNKELEDAIKIEVEKIRNSMESFTNNESKMEKLDYKLSELKEIFSFNNEEKLKKEIENLEKEIESLKSTDLYSNQKKLDDLELHLNSVQVKK